VAQPTDSIIGKLANCTNNMGCFLILLARDTAVYHHELCVVEQTELFGGELGC